MFRVLVLTVLASLAFACGATAQQINSPPGNSAIDEYLETVPAAGGDRPPGAHRGGRSPLAPAQRARIEQHGLDGRRLARIVDATGPLAQAGRSGNVAAPQRRTTPADRDPHAGSGASSRSPAVTLAAAALGDDGGGGLGRWLALILAASLAGALVIAVRGRRA